MIYDVRFPSKSIEKKFNKIFVKIPTRKIQQQIIVKLEKLTHNPRPSGKKYLNT